MAVAGWIAAALLLGGALVALHAPLPLPSPPPAEGSGRFALIHALDMECPCSQRILEYLRARGARPDVDETILLVAGDEPTRAGLVARGFTVVLVDEQALAGRYGIDAAPVLIIRRPDGTVGYRGSHRPRPQMPPIDLELLSELRRNHEPKPLPVIGCAVARALQERLDPLGLKYSLWR